MSNLVLAPLFVPLAEYHSATHFQLLKEDVEKINIKVLNTIYKSS